MRHLHGLPRSAQPETARAEGNALCTCCHAAAEFDAPKHPPPCGRRQGAQCVTCHMPTQNHMVIHARQDHSLRVPRPDLSLTLGSPNVWYPSATPVKPQWAASAMDQWYGRSWRERPHYGSTCTPAQPRACAPRQSRTRRQPTAPAIVRATAATLAQPHNQPRTLPAARALLHDADPRCVAALA